MKSSSGPIRFPSLRAPWVGWLILALLTAWYAWRQVGVFIDDPGRLHANDFKHIYLGAIFLREGGNPYDPHEFRNAAAILSRTEDPRFRSILPYVYLPFTGVVLAPLTAFRFPTAVWVWFWINQALFLGGGWLAARAVGLPRRAAIGALVLFLMAWNVPLTRSLTAGQLNGVLLFGFALVLWMTPRAPAWATGGVAAFAALFKLTPAILLFWFLSERMRRHAAWMVAWTVLLVAATLPVAGLRTYLEFIPVLRAMGYGKSTWAQFDQRFYRDPHNQSLNSFYHHVLVEDPAGNLQPWLRWSPGAANACTMVDALALIAATAWLVWPRRKRGGGGGEEDLLARVRMQEDRDTEDRGREVRGRAVRADEPDGGDDEGGRRTGLAHVVVPPPMPLVLRYSLFVVLSLLIPSILWDHYLVLMVLPFLALARLFLEWRTGRTPVLVFGIAVVVTGAAIPFDAPAFLSGPGLILMSAKLWPTVVVWFLLAWALILMRGSKTAGEQED